MANIFERYGIDYRKPKYWMPLFCYPFIWFIGYKVIETIDFEAPEKVDETLVTKNEFNVDLPSAHVGDDLGDKMDMMTDHFGRVKDLSGISNRIESDKDSLLKKEEYASRYNKDEARIVREQAVRDSLERELALARKGGGKDQSADEFTKELTAEERRKIEFLRNQGIDIETLEKELGINLSGKLAGIRIPESILAKSKEDSIQQQYKDSVRQVLSNNQAVKSREIVALDDDAEAGSVVKKVTETSHYFNTLSANKEESNLIKAIVDESLKAVDGSRVRLRLLDDVMVDGNLLPKGTYMYAELSGFANQRVKANIKSVLANDKIIKINLSVYDMDGLEGFFVPESAFRETMKDVGSQALSSGGLNVRENLTTGTSVANTAANVLQSTYQRVSQAISKRIKQNKVKLKYGSHVFLVNSKDIKKNRGGSTPNMPSRSRETVRGIEAGSFR